MHLQIRYRKKKLKGGFSSTRIELIHNYRSPMTRNPTNKCVAYLGSFKQIWRVYPPVKRYSMHERFWSKADGVLHRLRTSGVIDETDESRIREQVERDIPRPHASPLQYPNRRSLSIS